MAGKLLLENLPPGTTDIDVREEFARRGAVVAVEMVTAGGRSRNDAIVTLDIDPTTLHVMVEQLLLRPFGGRRVRLHVPYQHR